QDAVPVGVGAMAAALGLDGAKVADLCAAASVGDEIVVPATFNGGGNIVVSGHRAAVERFLAGASAAGARALPVEVSAPFHSPLMAPVEEPLRSALDRVAVRAPRVRVRSTARDAWLETAAAVRDALVAQLVAPVLWETCVGALAASGADEAWVLGSGKSLARMVQRLRLPWRVRAVGGPEDVEDEGSEA
ncbi:MAG: ACP S-malonyltransferase, partial [Myxococcales bacterium]|nr:ACP S-malonyltransferase [Myxococcales bacterium]